MQISGGTIARAIVLAIALINQILVACGLNTIPFADETVTEFITLAFTIGSAAVAYWKNNSYTKAAIEADKVKEAINGGKVAVDTVEELVK